MDSMRRPTPGADLVKMPVEDRLSFLIDSFDTLSQINVPNPGTGKRIHKKDRKRRYYRIHQVKGRDRNLSVSRQCHYQVLLACCYLVITNPMGAQRPTARDRSISPVVELEFTGPYYQPLSDALYQFTPDVPKPTIKSTYHGKKGDFYNGIVKVELTRENYHDVLATITSNYDAALHGEIVPRPYKKIPKEFKSLRRGDIDIRKPILKKLQHDGFAVVFGALEMYIPQFLPQEKITHGMLLP